MRELERLIYVSEAAPNLSAKGIQKIVNISHLHNQMSNITGLLVHDEGYFLQILEGVPSDVEATYQRISKDRRHSNCQLLLAQPITQRAFPKWLMGYRDRETLFTQEGLTLLELQAICEAADRTDIKQNRALYSFLATLLERFSQKAAA
ncbi:MAG: BLUF domain-containing protein [Pseudomonadota bacterium]